MKITQTKKREDLFVHLLLFLHLAKKRAEGKHYNVALSHATKKLVRLIYSMEKSGQAYQRAA